jgi:hypothetical protein
MLVVYYVVTTLYNITGNKPPCTTLAFAFREKEYVDYWTQWSKANANVINKYK